MRRILAALAFMLVSTAAFAQTRPAALFTSHMVVQRDTKIVVWGEDAPSHAVTVTASWNKSATATTAADGVFRCEIETPPAGGPFTMTIEGTSRVEITDILSGDVWLCGGQSNMEWRVADCPVDDADRARIEAKVREADGRTLRLFDVPNVLSAKPERTVSSQWTLGDFEHAWTFSAVGYWFARHVQKEIDVPIGLVGANWGGTLAEAWTSERTIRNFPEFAQDLAEVAEARSDPEKRDREYRARVLAWTEGIAAKDAGSKDLAFAKPDYDDKDWGRATLPGAFAGELQKHDGIVWYRRVIEIPAALAGTDLMFESGPIDDMDSTYLDGVLIGESIGPSFFAEARHYKIPKALATAGKHLLAIRVIDMAGPGGVMGAPEAFRIRGADEKAGVVALAGEWKEKKGALLNVLGRLPPARSLHPNVATVLYNGMIAPIADLRFKGALFYQGESNRRDGLRYREIFPAMIADWRATFSCGEFPFYYVQIAPYAYGGDVGEAFLVKEAQLLTLRTPNTGMAVLNDLGDKDDIHPKEKIEVGRRLALWALAKTYGKTDLEYSGPLFRTFRLEPGKVRIFFDHAKGLGAKPEGALTGFLIAGRDGKFMPADAAIDGETIVVSSKNCADPFAVRFSWGAADMPNLVNGAGLPASPFRTDAW